MAMTFSRSLRSECILRVGCGEGPGGCQGGHITGGRRPSQPPALPFTLHFTRPPRRLSCIQPSAAVALPLTHKPSWPQSPAARPSPKQLPPSPSPQLPPVDHQRPGSHREHVDPPDQHRGQHKQRRRVHEERHHHAAHQHHQVVGAEVGRVLAQPRRRLQAGGRGGAGQQRLRQQRARLVGAAKPPATWRGLCSAAACCRVSAEQSL